MTINEIHEIIARHDYRLTPALAFSIAFQAAKRERERIVDLIKARGEDRSLEAALREEISR